MRKIDLVFLLFLMVVSFDPTNHYTRLKDVLFVFLVIAGFLSLLKKKYPIAGVNRITILFFFMIPLWGILIANITGKFEDPNYAYGQLRSMMFVFLFFFLVTMKLDILLKLFWVNGIILSIVTLFLFLLGQTNEMFFEILYENRDENYLMALNRDFLGIQVNGLYFKSGPFMILAFIYNLYQYKGKFKLIYSVLLYLALLFAGSRTPALVQTLVLLIYIYDRKMMGRYFTVFATSIGFVMFVALTYSLATQKDEGSNEVKYVNFSSYLNDISEDGHVIWGAGLGSTFYAKGRSEKLSFSELSYMDILRMYGLIVGFFFIYLFFYPYFYLKRFFRYSLFLKRYSLGYVFFLILCGTNPLLLGSIGLMALTIMMAIVNKSRYFEIDKRNKILMFESCRY